MTASPTGMKLDRSPLSPGARALLDKRSQASSNPGGVIPRRLGDDFFELSAGQEMVWLAAQLDNSTAAYNRCTAIQVEGPLDRPAIQSAISEIVQRHSVLRSRITLTNGKPECFVIEEPQLPWREIDLSCTAIEFRSARVNELLDIEAKAQFSLDKEPWIRAGLISESERRNTLYITIHHIASDGWSDAVMLSELSSLYEAHAAGRSSPLIPPDLQFADFAAWERDREKSVEVLANVGYWRSRLSSAPTTQSLPTDRQRDGLISMAAGQVEVLIDPQTTALLADIGREQKATVAMTMLAAFQLFQFRISGQSDSVVGLSLAGRTTPEVGDLIGLFNKVVPLRVAIDRNMTFRSLLDAVRVGVLEAQAHQDAPASAIFESLPLTGKVRRTEFAQTLFNFRNMPEAEPTLRGLYVKTLEVFHGGSVADLQLEVTEDRDGLKCALRFRTDIFDEDTASRFLGHYSTLLKSISLTPGNTVGKLSLLTASERNQLLTNSNGPVRDYPSVAGIDQLMSDQARKTPDAVAVAFAEGALTYVELERAANRLALILRQRGISAGDFVGVSMERAPEMIVALFAILKCGAAFVPLDTEYPPDRLAYMLADTRPSLLLADGTGNSLLGGLGAEVLLADESWLDQSSEDPSPIFVPRPDDAVACVLYTSGSTGLPKGVLSTHRGIVNNLRAMQDMYGLDASDCLLQQTSPGFDAAAWEIFWPLSVGASTYLARHGGQRDANYVAGTIAANAISTVGFAPSMLKVMLGMPAFTGNQRIRRVMSYGEVLSPRLVSHFFKQMPNAQIHNLYGPTETSIAITTWNCDRDSKRASTPIGVPVANAEVYILDADFAPVPIGVQGEVFIGGICVSNGYHERPELTAERFVNHPLRPESGDRVYRTGDIARFVRDGAIEYVGRRDHQLKIRGLRVELEEVEAALCQLVGVRESVVVATRVNDDEPRLVAYVAADGNPSSAIEMRRMLARRLPPQFLPAQIVFLDELPHSINGKIDRDRLPDPEIFEHPLAVAADEPGTPVEERLISIWKAVLKCREVAPTDSFFDLGGHSLLAVGMLQQVADQLGATISLRVFYEDPTLRATARLIAGEITPEELFDRAPMVKVRESGSGIATLFYFNGQPLGGGRYAHRLASFLPPDQGLYIVPVPIFANAFNVEHVAERMVRLLREHQPTGPYQIGGNCFGATLALETAQQLAREEQVSLLVLIHPDAREPMHIGFRAIRRLALLGGLGEDLHFAEFSGAFDYTVKALKAIVNRQRQSSRQERVRRLMEAAAWLRSFAAKNARRPLETWRELRSKVPREADLLVQEQYRWELASKPELNIAGDPTAESELAAHAQLMSDAWTRYTPKAYDGRVAIIWPVEGPANPPWNARALWERVTPELDWHLVPGNHWTMLHDHFEHSARALAKSIDRARTSA